MLKASQSQQCLGETVCIMVRDTGSEARLTMLKDCPYQLCDLGELTSLLLNFQRRVQEYDLPWKSLFLSVNKGYISDIIFSNKLFLLSCSPFQLSQLAHGDKTILFCFTPCWGLSCVPLSSYVVCEDRVFKEIMKVK